MWEMSLNVVFLGREFSPFFKGKISQNVFNCVSNILTVPMCFTHVLKVPKVLLV